MKYYEAICVKRSRLTEIVMKLITDDVIDITPTELTNMTDTKLAYIILRHSLSYFNDHGPDDTDRPAIIAYDLRFLRVQRAMTFFNSNVPIEQHGKFIERLFEMFTISSDVNRHLIVDNWKKGTPVYLAIHRLIVQYLRDVSTVIERITATNATLSRYISQSHRFFNGTHPTDYDPADPDFDAYVKYENLLDRFQIEMDDIEPHRSLISAIMSPHFYDMQSWYIDGLDVHVFGCAFPEFVKQRWMSRSPWLRANIDHHPDGTSLHIMITRNNNLDEPTVYDMFGGNFQRNDLTDYFEEEPFIARKPVFPDGVPPTPGTFNFGSGGSVPPPPPPPPPPPTVPDDTSYVPDRLLESLARDHTNSVRADPDRFAEQDHMTRFDTTVEMASSISRAQLRRGDFFVTRRDRYGNTQFLVTYTRKSKKPIFSYVV